MPRRLFVTSLLVLGAPGCLGTQFAGMGGPVPLKTTEEELRASLEKARQTHGQGPFSLVGPLQERARFWSEEAAAGRKNLATVASLAASEVVEESGRAVEAYITSCADLGTMSFPRNLLEETPLTVAIAATPDRRAGAPQNNWIVLLLRPDTGSATLRSDAGGSTPGNLPSPTELSKFAVSRQPCGADWPRINSRLSSRF